MMKTNFAVQMDFALIKIGDVMGPKTVSMTRMKLAAARRVQA